MRSQRSPSWIYPWVFQAGDRDWNFLTEFGIGCLLGGQFAPRCACLPCRPADLAYSPHGTLRTNVLALCYIRSQIIHVSVNRACMWRETSNSLTSVQVDFCYIQWLFLWGCLSLELSLDNTVADDLEPPCMASQCKLSAPRSASLL